MPYLMPIAVAALLAIVGLVARDPRPIDVARFDWWGVTLAASDGE